MATITAAVFDVVAALPGRVCSMHDVVKALADIDRDQVTSAIHRLSEKGTLVARHNCFGFMFPLRQVQRGRPMVAAGHASANN